MIAASWEVLCFFELILLAPNPFPHPLPALRRNAKKTKGLAINFSTGTRVFCHFNLLFPEGVYYISNLEIEPKWLEIMFNSLLCQHLPVE